MEIYHKLKNCDFLGAFSRFNIEALLALLPRNFARQI